MISNPSRLPQMSTLPMWRQINCFAWRSRNESIPLKNPRSKNSSLIVQQQRSHLISMLRNKHHKAQSDHINLSLQCACMHPSDLALVMSCHFGSPCAGEPNSKWGTKVTVPRPPHWSKWPNIHDDLDPMDPHSDFEFPNKSSGKFLRSQRLLQSWMKISTPSFHLWHSIHRQINHSSTNISVWDKTFHFTSGTTS